MPVEEMADFSTLAYDVIKAKEPSIKVVGLGLATPQRPITGSCAR